VSLKVGNYDFPNPYNGPPNIFLFIKWHLVMSLASLLWTEEVRLFEVLSQHLIKTDLGIICKTSDTIAGLRAESRARSHKVSKAVPLHAMEVLGEEV
jgi:hypothetical protein